MSLREKVTVVRRKKVPLGSPLFTKIAAIKGNQIIHVSAAYYTPTSPQMIIVREGRPPLEMKFLKVQSVATWIREELNSSVFAEADRIIIVTNDYYVSDLLQNSGYKVVEK